MELEYVAAYGTLRTDTPLAAAVWGGLTYDAQVWIPDALLGAYRNIPYLMEFHGEYVRAQLFRIRNLATLHSIDVYEGLHPGQLYGPHYERKPTWVRREHRHGPAVQAWVYWASASYQLGSDYAEMFPPEATKEALSGVRGLRPAGVSGVV